MKQKPSPRRKRSTAKSVLRLPDLGHAKAAVLNSLNSMDAKRGYRHAILSVAGDQGLAKVHCLALPLTSCQGECPASSRL